LGQIQREKILSNSQKEFFHSKEIPMKTCLQSNDKKAQVLQFCDYAFTEQSLTASYWAVKTHTDMLYFIL